MAAYRPVLDGTPQQLCKSCRTCFMFYCMFYFTCDRSFRFSAVLLSYFQFDTTDVRLLRALRFTFACVCVLVCVCVLKVAVIGRGWSSPLFFSRVLRPSLPTDTCVRRPITCVYTVSQKTPEVFWHFFPNGWEFSFQILGAYCTFPSTLDYTFLSNYLQLSLSYAILSLTTIICSKCPPSAETHSGWSHLIWHNFVTVWDYRIKICRLEWIGTCIRRIKFGLKIPYSFGKMWENASVRFGRRWTFWAYGVNWIVAVILLWHDFVKVAGNWIKMCSPA